MKDKYHKYISEKKLAEKHWWFKLWTKIIYGILVNHLFSSNDEKGMKKNIKILDIGSGMGQLSKVLQKFGTVYGVEPNEISFKTSKKENPGIIFWNDYFPDKNSIKHKYDVICLCDLLEHISDSGIILEEVHKRLTSNGVVLVTVPAYQWMWSNSDEMSQHFKRYSKKLLLMELKYCGFKTIYLSYFMMFLFPLAVIARKIIEPFKR